MVAVVSAEIRVEGSRLEHMVSGSEQGGGYGSDSFFGAVAAAQAVVLGLEVAVLGARGRPGALRQSGLSHGAPFFMRLERRLSALSSLRGQSPAQGIR